MGSHSRKRANYPNAGLEESYCRNPDGEPSNWCYTTDPNKIWDFCYVPLCGCSATLAGETCGCGEVGQADYRGTISTTASGLECQRWDTQDPNTHNRTPQRYPDSDLSENYCRNPGETGSAAWCYTTNPNKRWDYCDVPLCGVEAPSMSPSYECSATLAGETCGCSIVNQADYRGTISTTASGLECQRWDTQDPHTHNRTPQRYPVTFLRITVVIPAANLLPGAIRLIQTKDGITVMFLFVIVTNVMILRLRK